jgi:hypothetical protein
MEFQKHLGLELITGLMEVLEIAWLNGLYDKDETRNLTDNEWQSQKVKMGIKQKTHVYKSCIQTWQSPAVSIRTYMQ